MATRSIIIKASIDQLPSINQFIAETVTPAFGLLIPKIELAMEELMVNVCNYAYGDATGDAEISCRLVNFDGRPHFAISIRDWGRAFDPFSDSPEPDASLSLSERPIGGLGVHMVKKFASHYCYEYSREANLSELLFEKPDLR
jgi:anti-sigma regulatory factor (Ser/Thr protein kinase)